MHMNPRLFVQGFGRFYVVIGGYRWSRLVTVGHGLSRGGPFYFTCGRFFLVTAGHGLGPCVSMNIMLNKKTYS